MGQAMDLVAPIVAVFCRYFGFPMHLTIGEQ